MHKCKHLLTELLQSDVCNEVKRKVSDASCNTSIICFIYFILPHLVTITSCSVSKCSSCHLSFNKYPSYSAQVQSALKDSFLFLEKSTKSF